MTELPIVYETEVKPEWVDYNKHMGDFAYGIVFSLAGDGFLELAELTPEYRERTGCSIYTLEAHTKFLKEALLGDHLRVAAQLLDWDPKRVHLYLFLYGDDGTLAAEQEQLVMHMRLSEGAPPRVEPFPPFMAEKLRAISERHRLMPLPAGAGKRIGIRRPQASA